MSPREPPRKIRRTDSTAATTSPASNRPTASASAMFSSPGSDVSGDTAFWQSGRKTPPPEQPIQIKGTGRGRVSSGGPGAIRAGIADARKGTTKSGGGKLVLKVKPKAAPTGDEEARRIAANEKYVDDAVIALRRAVRVILSKTSQPGDWPDSLPNLYTMCERLVLLSSKLKNKAGEPYASFGEIYSWIEGNLGRRASELKQELLSQGVTDSLSRAGGSAGRRSGAEAYLRKVESEVKEYIRNLVVLRSVFLELDRSQGSSFKGTWYTGLSTLASYLAEDDEHEVGLRQRIASCLDDLVEDDRRGVAVDRSFYESFSAYLRQLLAGENEHAFVALISEPFAKGLAAFYKVEAREHAPDPPVATKEEASTSQTTEQAYEAVAPMEGEAVPATSKAYLDRIVERVEEEGNRAAGLLGEEERGRTAGAVRSIMVGNHLDWISKHYVGIFVEQAEHHALQVLYKLMQAEDRISMLSFAFSTYVRARGLATVSDTSKDDTMIQRLIDLRNQLDAVVKNDFAADPSFKTVVNKAFEFFINKRENKPAEMIAKFLDHRLRVGNKGLNDEELEKSLTDVLTMFRYTQGKDIFEAFYKRDFAKRLLLNKSASFDAERTMLLKLREECGPGFSQNLEIMFKDVDLSTDVMRAYQTSPLRSLDPFDLHVNILSMGNWPTYPSLKVRLPAEMGLALDRFKTFYVAKHSGRTLTWQPSLDYCTVKAVFPKAGAKGKKELNVSLFQALVLLLFNDVPQGGKLSFAEIRDATDLDKTELARTMQSLACGKVRVLTKHPKGRDVNETDEFSFNEDFKDDHVRIKINQIQQKETPEENKATTDRVLTDRASHIQLAIVRIMKARKTLKFVELVMEIVTQVKRFKVETAEIKKAIGSLIDREYIRRSEDQANVFEYVA